MKVQVLSYDGDVLKIEYPKIGKSITVDTSKLPHSDHARRHGWKQRFGDLKAGDETGAEKFEEAKRLKAHLENGGDWNMSGERDTVSIVIEALNRLDAKKYPKAKLLKAVEAKPEQVKAWRANTKVKAMIAAIYAERAKKALEESDESEVEIDLE